MSVFEQLFLHQFLEEIRGLRKDLQDMSAATDRLAASITTFDATVQKAVTALATGDQAAVDAVANQAADAIDAANTALTNALPAG